MNRFGFCTLDLGEFLFRRYEDNSYCDVMFFAFRPSDSFSDTTRSRKTQKWKTKRKLNLIIFIESLDARGWVSSNINTAFSILNPDIDISGFNDLTIKQHRKDIREKFTKQLMHLGFDGWVTSIEGRYQMELCLFTKDNRDAVIYICDKSYLEDISTLHRLKLFPPTNIVNSSKQLNEMYPLKTFIKSNWDNKFIRERQNVVTLRHLLNNNVL